MIQMPERRDVAFQVVEIAPAFGLDEKVRASVHESAVKLCKFLNYQNAGTVEFMVDKNGDFYFLEVNPRIQVCLLSKQSTVREILSCTHAAILVIIQIC